MKGIPVVSEPPNSNSKVTSRGGTNDAGSSVVTVTLTFIGSVVFSGTEIILEACPGIERETFTTAMRIKCAMEHVPIH